MKNLHVSFLRHVELMTQSVLGKSFEHLLHARLKQVVMNESVKMRHASGLLMRDAKNRRSDCVGYLMNSYILVLKPNTEFLNLVYVTK